MYFNLVQLNVFLLYCHFIKCTFFLLISCSKYIYGYENKKIDPFQRHNFQSKSLVHWSLCVFDELEALSMVKIIESRLVKENSGESSFLMSFTKLLRDCL